MNFKMLTVFLAIIALSKLQSANESLRMFEERQQTHEHVTLEPDKEEIALENVTEDISDVVYDEKLVQNALTDETRAHNKKSECVKRIMKCTTFKNIDKECSEL